MADKIDKSLTQGPRGSVTIPGEEEIVEQAQEVAVAQEESKGPVEVTEQDDGSVEVDFDPNAASPEGGDEHYANLAEFLPDEVLGELGSDLTQKYMDYNMSRKDWEQTYTKGLDLLGFKYDMRTEPFQGASGATHPVLAEAVTQFQALAYKELLPANGPVRTQVVGAPNPEKTQQAERVKDYMNYELMEKMKDYEPDFDSMLFYLPLAGSAFKKVYYDELEQRAVSKFVPADDLIVPYSATSLEDAEAVIHRVKMSKNDLRKQQIGGFYLDIELGTPGYEENDVEKKERELEGQRKSKDDDIYTLLECHVNLDLEGFEHTDDQGQPSGIKIPYIVTVELATRKVLAIRRNYQIGDPNKNKIDYFVHFKFLPGLGFYGFGLIHMIGGLSRTATAALRQLLDAGTLSNLPAGFKMRGIRIRDDAQSIQPGEFRDVDAPGGNLKDSFMMLPFKEPSQTLLSLMGIVVQAGQRFASIADLQVGDGNQQAAVGTTVALLERGSRTMSAIHKRIYSSLKQEFKLLARVFKLYLPPEYPYDVVGGQRMIKQQDFDDRVDIVPVADPNIFSQTQRISLAQTELQLATSNPQMHNLYQAYRNMYEALGVKDIDQLLVKPQQPQPMDPALENIMEHISLMAQEQIELEFAQEIPQLAQMQQMAAQNPQVAQQLQAMTQKLESRKAVLIAEMMEEFLKEEREVTSGFGNDPIAKLRARELDLRAMDNERKKREGQEKINLDRMKAMMNQSDKQDKLDQNAELAKLRADTSIEKTILSKSVPNVDKMMPSVEIEKYEGENR